MHFALPLKSNLAHRFVMVADLICENKSKQLYIPVSIDEGYRHCIVRHQLFQVFQHCHYTVKKIIIA